MKLSWWLGMAWCFFMLVLLLFGYTHEAEGADCTRHAALEDELYRAIQDSRITPMRVHPALQGVARLKALTLTKPLPMQIFTLHALDGVYWPGVLSALGWNTPAHESIVARRATVDEVMRAFEGSAPHWAHIVDEGLNVFGFGLSCKDRWINVVIYTGVE